MEKICRAFSPVGAAQGAALFLSNKVKGTV